MKCDSINRNRLRQISEYLPPKTAIMELTMEGLKIYYVKTASHNARLSSERAQREEWVNTDPKA